MPHLHKSTDTHILELADGKFDFAAHSIQRPEAFLFQLTSEIALRGASLTTSLMLAEQLSSACDRLNGWQKQATLGAIYLLYRWNSEKPLKSAFGLAAYELFQLLDLAPSNAVTAGLTVEAMADYWQSNYSQPVLLENGFELAALLAGSYAASKTLNTVGLFARKTAAYIKQYQVDVDRDTSPSLKQ